jgi:hypothetical protein
MTLGKFDSTGKLNFSDDQPLKIADFNDTTKAFAPVGAIIPFFAHLAAAGFYAGAVCCLRQDSEPDVTDSLYWIDADSTNRELYVYDSETITWVTTGFVSCEGQILSDASSPIDGQTIPSLNTSSYFIRGASTSGDTGGTETHTHITTGIDSNDHTGTDVSPSNVTGSGNLFTATTHSHSFTLNYAAAGNVPAGFTAIMLMRVK